MNDSQQRVERTKQKSVHPAANYAARHALIRPSRIPPPPMPVLPAGSLLPPKLPRVSMADESVPTTRRSTPVESDMDRLWRTMGQGVRVQWLDRDRQYIMFWVDLTEMFAKDFKPLEDEALCFKLKSKSGDFNLKTASQLTHESVLCFVHKSVFHVRTNLPAKLIPLFERAQSGEEQEFLFVIHRQRGGRERKLPFIRLGPSEVFGATRST